MSSELKIKSIKGVSWNLLEQMGMFGLKFVLGIILARLLTPEDYGLIGLISIFFAISSVLINSGLGMAYIRKEKVSNIDANTVFFINLLISIVIYISLYFLAPLISDFYEKPILTNLTRVLGLIVIINAFKIIQDSQIRRDINFKKRAKFSLISTFVSLLAGITAAYYGLGVWSLVIQQLLNAFILTFSLTVTNSWKPSFNFSSESMKNMFNFGGWIVLNSILREFFMHIYVMIIGKLFPVAQAGFYKKGREIDNMIATRISSAISEVSFSILSKNQNNIAKMRNTFRKFLTHTIFIILPLLTILIVVADSFVLVMLKEKWAPMIPYIRLFALIGILFPVKNMNKQLIYAIGKSRLNFNIGIVVSLLRLLNIFLMLNFGVIYIIIGEVVLSLIEVLIYTYFINKYISYGFFSQVNDFKIIFLGGLISGLIGFTLHLYTTNNYLLLFGGAFIVTTSYILFQLIFGKSHVTELLSLLKTIKQNN